MENTINYQQTALDFAKATGTKLEILSSDYASHFEDDKEKGIYVVRTQAKSVKEFKGF